MLACLLVLNRLYLLFSLPELSCNTWTWIFMQMKVEKRMQMEAHDLLWRPVCGTSVGRSEMENLTNSLTTAQSQISTNTFTSTWLIKRIMKKGIGLRCLLWKCPVDPHSCFFFFPSQPLSSADSRLVDPVPHVHGAVWSRWQERPWPFRMPEVGGDADGVPRLRGHGVTTVHKQRWNLPELRSPGGRVVDLNRSTESWHDTGIKKRLFCSSRSQPCEAKLTGGRSLAC